MWVNLGYSETFRPELYDTNFYPTLAEFQENILDTGAGLMEFCLAAADIGLA